MADPKITAEQIVDSIAAEEYSVHGGRLTICVLTLTNGFMVVGQSAAAFRSNFDADLGQKIARENAIDQIWPLMGYALRERLADVDALTGTGDDQGNFAQDDTPNGFTR